MRIFFLCPLVYRQACVQEFFMYIVYWALMYKKGKNKCRHKIYLLPPLNCNEEIDPTGKLDINLVVSSLWKWGQGQVTHAWLTWILINVWTTYCEPRLSGNGKIYLNTKMWDCKQSHHRWKSNTQYPMYHLPSQTRQY